MANKVYSVNWYRTINTLTNLQTTFNIQSPGRQIKLKSILVNIDVLFVAPAVGHAYLETTQEHTFFLSLGTAGQKIASAVNVTGGTPINNTGDQIRINKLGQYIFDSFFITNSIDFIFGISNFSAADVIYDASIIIETEENPIYQ